MQRCSASFSLIGGHGSRVHCRRFYKLLTAGSGFGLEPFPDFGQRGARDDFSGTNQSSGMFESVVFVTVDVGLNHQIGSLLPNVAIHFLSNREALADHIEQMPRSLAGGPAPFQMHGDNAIGTHLPQRSGRNRIGQHAIDQLTPANLYWQKHSRVGATGAYGINQRTGVKEHTFARRKVGSSHDQRNAQLFEGLYLEDAVEKADHALITGEAIARKRPTGEVLETNFGGYLLKVSRRQSAAVSGADERAHARSGNISYGDIFCFEDFEHADVSHAASKAAAQRHSDANVRNWRTRLSAGKLSAESLYRPDDSP